MILDIEDKVKKLGAMYSAEYHHDIDVLIMCVCLTFCVLMIRIMVMNLLRLKLRLTKIILWYR